MDQLLERNHEKHTSFQRYWVSPNHCHEFGWRSTWVGRPGFALPPQETRSSVRGWNSRDQVLQLTNSNHDTNRQCQTDEY